MARFLTVTPNPAIDVTYRVERQVIGETVRVTDVRRTPGGKGINVARVLKALGREVVALQPLGGDAGKWMRDTLPRLGLPAIDCEVDGETRTTVAVVDAVAHPTLLSEPGHELRPEDWSRFAEALRRNVRPGDWVIIAGSFPPGSAPEHLDLLITAAHASGALVAVDTSGPMLRVAAGLGADLLKANEREIVEATGEGDGLAGLRALARSGATVMMSRGADGSALLRPHGTLHEQSAVPDLDGNPTGAGDAATAGLIAALAEGHDDATALRWAAVCGAAAVLSPLAGEIDVDLLADLEARLSPATTERLTPLPTERSPS